MSERFVPAAVIAALVLLVFVAVPLALHAHGGGYYYQLASLALIFILLASSLHLVSGVTGLLHLGQAAFYGVGAYLAALAGVAYHVPFWLALPLAGLGSALIALLVALPTMRLVSIYFAVATLAIGQMINIILMNWVPVTGGPNGVTLFSPMDLFGWEITDNTGIYYVVAVTVSLSVWAIYRLSYSYYGNALRALREDDQCAAAMGIDAVRLKTQVFTAAAFFAGIAGALWAYTTGYISPNDFKFSETILILAMVVVGGLGSLPGAIIGALLLVLLPEALRGFGDLRNIIVGSVMFLSILFLPKGLCGEVPAISLARGLLGGAWKTDAGKKVGWK
ncbi:branched-chain amino acid ABC transporter permease [Pseudomonas sp. CF161]|uniref:branched-chain amino acid ABC transporter permease n=1 Tax=Pseudomonas sp. CF161 TaxID=911241 RepID=UPI00035502BE|nr:branched-chain amino acid ABC transporter permease [Pseudomonas sp. CF161]EPL05078.1 inner-membrane translocator [Pseudomonas sp. CF161]